VLDQKTNPLIGSGFYSFWDTEKARNFFHEANFIHINTAHNGYLEAYLDGGCVAVVLLVLYLLAAGKTALDRLFSGTAFGRMAFVFWLLAVLYNFSESDFFRMEPLWL